MRTAQDYGAPSRLVEATVAVNDARKSSMAMRVIAACGGSVRGKTIAVLGLTFKPETDDMRDSPSLSIVARLAGDGAIIRAFDPGGHGAGAAAAAGLGACTARDALDAAAGADALVLITEWNEFRALAPERLARGDARAGAGRSAQRLRPGRRCAQAGFDYHGIGRAGDRRV